MMRLGFRSSLLLVLLALLMQRGILWLLFYTQCTPPASQKRFITKHGPSVNSNVVKEVLPVPVFTTDDQITWLEKDFRHRHGDVWVTTYPKTGTTWTQHMVNLLNGHEPAGGAGGLFEHCPWPEMNFTVLSTLRSKLQSSADSTSAVPRCFKSHWWNRDHMDIDKLPATSKVIFVYRDAESVFRSYYHHIMNKYGFYQVTEDSFPHGSWDTLFNMFMAGELDYGCYMQHTASWWKARDRPNVLALRYEDLKAHHVDNIRKIAEFIGVGANKSTLEYVRHHSSFEVMKAMESEDVAMKFFQLIGFFKGSHIRSGGGKEKSLFSTEQRKRLQQRYEEVLAPLGMPRDFILSHALE